MVPISRLCPLATVAVDNMLITIANMFVYKFHSQYKCCNLKPCLKAVRSVERRQLENYYTANGTLVCADRYVGDGDTDRREILRDCTAVSLTVLLPYWWQYL